MKKEILTGIFLAALVLLSADVLGFDQIYLHYGPKPVQCPNPLPIPAPVRKLT